MTPLALVAATLALAAALGATGSLELELRSELRGLEGGPASARLFEPVPYQLEPTAGLSGQLDPRLSYTANLAPRLLLLAGPSGGLGVHSSAVYLSGSGSLAWRADDRTTLSAAWSGSRGTLALSPLSQLTTATAAAAAAGPAQPGAGLLDPAAGIRTGEFGSEALRAALDWRATPTLVLGGGMGQSGGGGVSAVDRVLFPSASTLSADLRGALAMTPRDGLALQGSYARTRLSGQGAIGIAGALLKWSRRLEQEVNGAIGVGLSATVQDTIGTTARAASRRPSPSIEASISQPAPGSGSSLGFGATLGLAPYVDQFANVVRQRLAGSLDVDWRLDSSHRISWVASGASAVGGGGAGLVVAAAEMGGWLRRAELEFGLTVRAGYQENPAPVGAVTQWSIGLVARWKQTPVR